MKASDYVISFLEKNNVKDVFLLSGGGMMHLLNSLAHSSINTYYNLNEQATSICADAYAQYTNDLSVCFVTTGPGGTNAITGVVSAYQDSTPMLVISGQVKTADLAPEGVRVYGPQEVNITGLVKGVTKYAVTVTNPLELRYHLEKAVYLATHGRRGPVWIDIPLDVQASNIDEELLVGYENKNEENNASIENSINAVIDELCKAKRPALLLGHGVVAAKAQKSVVELAEMAKIPVLTTWRAKELFREDYLYYFGSPGAQAPRYSNFVLEKSDFLLIIGSRLDWSLTAFDEKNFAVNAKKFIVDIEQQEMDKLKIEFEDKIHCDAASFIKKLYEGLSNRGCSFNDTYGWLGKCTQWKEKYPIYKEKMSLETNGVWGYDFAKALNTYSDDNDIYSVSPTGRVCIAMNLGIALKGNQRFVAPRGLGSMGYALPTAIGACVAGGKRTICFEGDGSLQHNLQELQLIVTYKLPIKLFVYNNGGYSSIYGMQNSHFSGYLAGCTSENGVMLPSIKKIAEAYGIAYDLISSSDELEEGMERVLKDNRPVICEVIGDIRFEEIPRTQTRIHEDGTITSSSMLDLFPFIDLENI